MGHGDDGGRSREIATVGTQVQLERKGWGTWSIKATGLYAGATISSLTLVCVMVWLSPLTNPQHFVLSLVSTFIGGMFVSAIASASRLHDSLARGDEYRAELQRVSAEKSAVEKLLLNHRQSSISTRPKGK
jgi:predicted small integral membrane protein